MKIFQKFAAILVVKIFFTEICKYCRHVVLLHRNLKLVHRCYYHSKGSDRKFLTINGHYYDFNVRLPCWFYFYFIFLNYKKSALLFNFWNVLVSWMLLYCSALRRRIKPCNSPNRHQAQKEKVFYFFILNFSIQWWFHR